MKEIWVLGAGQLGAMLQHAAMPLALPVNTIDINASKLPDLSNVGAITVELEHWPKTHVTQLLSNHPTFLNRKSLKIFADRAIQKRLLDNMKLPHANWQLIDNDTCSKKLLDRLGSNVLLKRRSGGYDGKGQHWLNAENNKIPEQWHHHAIAEQKISFDEELSIIGARNAQGDCVFYPLTVNLHYNGILLASVSPVDTMKKLQKQAEEMLEKLMSHLDYIGVMSVECFLVDDRLIINEIAPRVHNSGHWTQAGASISQFEMHLRAVAGLPIKTALVKNQTVMVNLLGTHYDQRWLAVDGAELYWYGKENRPMRKVGHINMALKNTTLMSKSLDQLEPLLDDFYPQAIVWLKKHLSN